MWKCVLVSFLLFPSCFPVWAESSDSLLSTKQGIMLEAQAFEYSYTEPNMSEQGMQYGAAGSFTFFLVPKALFVSVQGRYAKGNLNYSSPTDGTIQGVPNQFYEARAVVGLDSVIDSSSSLSPYVGYGYRYLYNDGQDLVSSKGYGFYRRKSHYYYAPIGLNYRYCASDCLQINGEYDRFLRGYQESYLGDVSSAYPSDPIVNQQHVGYGVRGAVDFVAQNWFAGIFGNYWNISASDSSDFLYSGELYSAIEPQNHTIEAGLEAGLTL